MGPREVWPNWREDGAYAYCANLTNRGWAWEFLRRNPALRKDLTEALRSAAPSRILTADVIRLPESPVDLSAGGSCFASTIGSGADVFWRRHHFPRVLAATAGRAARSFGGDVLIFLLFLAGFRFCLPMMAFSMRCCRRSPKLGTGCRWSQYLGTGSI